MVDILIKYTDATYDIRTETSTNWKTVIYDLDDYKVVDFVQFFNHEWWYAGYLAVDYMEVNY